ncbi:MAG: hypothetical protein KF861_17805, partial [Planctomycetaceae bacterium]|nr:hypothetical protein [Planctomycetaceae bacterium]
MTFFETADASAEAPIWSPRRLQVPRTDRRLLCDPPLRLASELAVQNQAQLDGADINLQGRTLFQMRHWSRRACLSAAAQYTAHLDKSSATEVTDSHVEGMLYVAGHQPSLYHPGVWVKNFAIDQLARSSGGIGLNLIVDNDTFSSTAIRVPTGPRDGLAVTRVPFDSPRPVQPWEEAPIVDQELFTTFAERVAETISGPGRPLLLTDMWPDAVAYAATSPRLVDCLTAARHAQEQRWGLSNWELPLSRLCETDPFLWFASHILANLPQFSECHNLVLHAYRQLNRVR